MSIKVEPNIVVDDIEIEVDDNNEYGAEQVLPHWGKSIPVVKVNDFVVPLANIIGYNVYVEPNKLLKYDLTILDDGNFIKDSFDNNEYNKVTIFIGNNFYYHKYNGIILNTTTNSKSKNITFNGCIFTDGLYNTEQLKFDDKSVNDILTEINTNSLTGLFTNDNDSLNFVIPEVINANMSNLDFMKYVINNFTNNIWSFDANYIMYVGNLESFIEKEISKFEFYENHQLPQPIDISFSNRLGTNSELGDAKPIEGDFVDNIEHLKFENYSIDDVKLDILKSEYSIFDELNSSNILFENNFGIGSKTENYFSGFKDKYFPNYSEIVNKQLTGKIVTLEMVNNIYEIFPFMSVNLDLWTSNKDTTDIQEKNEIECGKRTVVAYSYHYKKRIGKIQQKIKLI